MCDIPKNAYHTVTLLGGGPVDTDDLSRVLRLAPDLVAADGGAKHAHTHKIPVKHIVGDFDSLTNVQYWRNSGVNLIELDEQESTDFEKCLYSIEAGVYVGLGFLGERLDHTLACLRTLAAYPEKRVILMGEAEVAFLSPLKFAIEIDAGDRVSLFPMGEVMGLSSKGLRWTIEGLAFSPSGQIGTSNESVGGVVEMQFSERLMVAILPKYYLERVFDCLLGLADAPAR